jgi:hypothetical protein
MKLQQDQVWKQGDQFIRITHLQRLEVKYKSTKKLSAKEGTHHHVSKKDFCRLLKGATLISSAQSREAGQRKAVADTPSKNQPAAGGSAAATAAAAGSSEEPAA